jgi:sensor histidine kinase YesM
MLYDIYKKPDFIILRFSYWHLIIPVIIGFIITLYAYPEGYHSIKVMSFVVFYSLAIGIPSMKCFEFIEWKIEKSIPWLKKPGLRLFLTAFLEILIGILILVGVNYFIYIVIKKQEIEMLYSKTYEGTKYLLFTIVAAIIIFNSIYFFKSWKQAAVNEEKLKIEKLAIEYEALKNQVNPHFLFNNLTVLSSLVYKDQQKAVIFIHQLSNVFRYVLECRDREVVDFATERKLLESISYLYKMRHEDSLQIKINLPDATDKYIVPMALQMLLENAIKHNIISVSKPLMVEIREEEGYITVHNNLQPKKSDITSCKIGLENIISRYKYLTDKDVLIEISSENFVAKIPILDVKNV